MTYTFGYLLGWLNPPGAQPMWGFLTPCPCILQSVQRVLLFIEQLWIWGGHRNCHVTFKHIRVILGAGITFVTSKSKQVTSAAQIEGARSDCTSQCEDQSFQSLLHDGGACDGYKLKSTAYDISQEQSPDGDFPSLSVFKAGPDRVDIGSNSTLKSATL